MQSMVKTKRLFTYEDYAAMPDDGKRYELIWGEVVVAPSPNVEHQGVSCSLLVSIASYVNNHALGWVFPSPLDVVLDAHNTVQPDILFVSKARETVITRENIRGAPDLVVEISSPSTEDRDKLVKRKLYEEHGVLEYWLVDREVREISVYVLADRRFQSFGVFGEKDILGSRVLPGLKIPVGHLFQTRL
jgi:Uma2 family endonuclease